jgi:hypothetical protein
VEHVPDPLLLRKPGSTGNRIRDLRICSQELWPLDHSKYYLSNLELFQWKQQVGSKYSNDFRTLNTVCALSYVGRVGSKYLSCIQTGLPSKYSWQRITRLGNVHIRDSRMWIRLDTYVRDRAGWLKQVLSCIANQPQVLALRYAVSRALSNLPSETKQAHGGMLPSQTCRQSPISSLY